MCFRSNLSLSFVKILIIVIIVCIDMATLAIDLCGIWCNKLLFSTAFHDSSDSLNLNELNQILELKEFLADYLFMLVVAAKQMLPIH